MLLHRNQKTRGRWFESNWRSCSVITMGEWSMLSVAKGTSTGSCWAKLKIIWVITLNWPASLFLKQLWSIWPMHASCHAQYHKNSTALVSKYEHFLNLSGSVKVVSVHWTEQMMGLEFIMTLAFLSMGERSWKQPNHNDGIAITVRHVYGHAMIYFIIDTMMHWVPSIDWHGYL